MIRHTANQPWGGDSVKKLVRGLHQFQTEIFTSQRALFEKLSKGQSPETLFITCSDSRINPNLITQTEPGELFIIRNAGNIVPAFGHMTGGEAATIEFAVAGLKVKDIIICGHSLCGAMDAILNPEKVKSMPVMSSWLTHAEATKRIALENYGHMGADDLRSIVVQENVLVQLENLRTHPAVAVAMARGDLRLHGWVYKIETGSVFYYDSSEAQFLALTENSNPEPFQRQPASLERLI